MNNHTNIATPEPGELRLCLICATEKPWGVWDSKTGAAVCKECRDKARTPPPDASGGPGDLMVGICGREVVINLDHDRTGHIVFSPAQARHLSSLLRKKAIEAEAEVSDGLAKPRLFVRSPGSDGVWFYCGGPDYRDAAAGLGNTLEGDVDEFLRGEIDEFEVELSRREMTDAEVEALGDL